MKRRRLPGFLVVVLLGLSAALWYYNHYYSSQTGSNDPPAANDGNFDRNLIPVIYTRHARCRMGCRHIDESEVKEILQNGTINYHKSDLHSKPDPKYALEGYTHDNQKVRIIFAPSKRGMVVITCIDVAEEWQCDCK